MATICISMKNVNHTCSVIIPFNCTKYNSVLVK